MAGKLKRIEKGLVTLLAWLAFNGPAAAAPQSNFTGLWWNSPAGSESGWALAVDHQGPIVFAAWVTYDYTGSPTWFFMPRAEVSPLSDPNMAEPRANTYAGPLYQARAAEGIAGDVGHFFPREVVVEQFGQGNAGIHFQADGASTFWYPLVGHEIDGPIEKSITPFQFGSTVTSCSEDGVAGPSANYQDLWWNAANYQGLWWNSPAGSESGWGLYLAHQGDVIFALLLTYDFQGSPTWYSIVLRQDVWDPTEYEGTVYMSTGPRYDILTFPGATYDPGKVKVYDVGTAYLGFRDPDHGVFSVALGAEDVGFLDLPLKSITRMSFAARVVCH
jgi:hypothetical protein